MRIDLTGTMELAIFLRIFEMLLGILCVSIPMLRPVYARLRTKTRTALHPSESNPDDLEAIYQRPKKSVGGNLGLQDPTLNTHDHPENVWEMRDYDPGRPKVGYAGFVTAGPAPNEDQSDDGGSEQKLTQAVTHGTVIQVERKWTIHRD
ncbi:integral membrane protein [Apiospora saccharicola]|uniref:Integral membrane protein n=1 Tax=Apiospora saccharicola TaxID=335842 RepID=A0ABR1VNX1_9PEZI